MIKHLTTHKELFSDDDIIDELLHDYSTGLNVTWGQFPLIENSTPQSHILPHHLQALSPHSSQSKTFHIPQEFKPLSCPKYKPSYNRVGIQRELRFLRLKCLDLNCRDAKATTNTSEHLMKRKGILDSKLILVSKIAHTEQTWALYSSYAVSSCYACDIHGHNIFLARLNALNSILDFFKKKFKKAPTPKLVKGFTSMVSWNFFQLDGYTLSIPHFFIKDNVVQHNTSNITLSNDELPLHARLYNWEQKTYFLFNDISKYFNIVST